MARFSIGRYRVSSFKDVDLPSRLLPSFKLAATVIPEPSETGESIYAPVRLLSNAIVARSTCNRTIRVILFEPHCSYTCIYICTSLYLESAKTTSLQAPLLRMITIGRNVGFRSIRDIVYSTFSRTNEFEIELVPRTFSVQRLNARNTAIRTCRPGNNVTGAVPLAPHIYICRCVALIVSK